MMKLFLFPLELLGILMKPLSLAIRLYANIMFGHFMIYFAYLLFRSLFGPLGFIPLIPLVILELGVFVIQRFVFTYLVCLYFDE